MKAKVIYNPYSGRWLAAEKRPEAEAALQEAGLDYDLVLSERPGHAQELAIQAVEEGYSPVIAAGGDGTLSEVVNGLIQAQGDERETVGPFGFLPVGTANDLANNLGFPLDLRQAARTLVAGKTRLVDVCQVNERYFINNAGLGLEPFITVIQSKMTRLRGVIRYLVATLKGIAQNPVWRMRLEWEGGEYEGPITLISIGNGAVTGGLFYTVPHADPFDGKLSFIHGYLPTRWKILLALPMTMKPAEGNISEHPAVFEYHTTWLKVHSETPTPAHADGELFTTAIQDVDYRIHPARLEVILK